MRPLFTFRQSIFSPLSLTFHFVLTRQCQKLSPTKRRIALRLIVINPAIEFDGLEEVRVGINGCGKLLGGEVDIPSWEELPVAVSGGNLEGIDRVVGEGHGGFGGCGG